MKLSLALLAGKLKDKCFGPECIVFNFFNFFNFFNSPPKTKEHD